MNDVEKFGYEVFFNSVVNSITTRRTDFSETALIYLNEAKEFFNRVIRGLESVVSKEKSFFVQDLHKIIELAGFKSLNVRENRNGIIYFEKMKNHLKRLRQNPQEFYNSEDSKKLLSLCEKMRDLYTKELYHKSKEHYELLDS